MSTVWGTRNRFLKVLVFLGFRHRGTIVTTVDNAFSLSCGARKPIHTLASHWFVPAVTSSTGSAARRQCHQGARTGKRSFSTGVDSTVEKEMTAVEGVREDVEAHPRPGTGNSSGKRCVGA